MLNRPQTRSCEQEAGSWKAGI